MVEGLGSKGQEEFLKTARERFDQSEDAYSEWRKDASESMNFLVGNQWPERNYHDRVKDGRPCLTVNRLGQYVRLVANEIARSRPGMKVHPVDSFADVNTSSILLGLVRHIERVEDSSVAYGTATDNQVRCGLGFFGFQTSYSSKDSFAQELSLRYYPNPLAVYPDPSSKKFDGSDSRFYFVIEKMAKESYKEKWPESEVNQVGFRSLTGYDQWIEKDEIQVAEYWYVETKTRNLVKLKTGETRWRDELKDNYDDKQIADMIDDDRDVEERTVKRATINGHEVLARDEWPGPWIPIFPVYGEVIYVDGKPKIRGLIKDAMEPQRVLNYMFSGTMEAIALAPLNPYIAVRKQIAHDRDSWRESNTRSVAVLEYDMVVEDTDGGRIAAPAPRRDNSEPPIQALVAGLGLAEDSIRHAVGLHAPSIGALSSERSGKAIEKLQGQGSLATFHFVLNFARTIRFAVKQLVGDGENKGLIQTIYNEPGRIIRIIGEDEVEKMVMLGKQRHRDTRGFGRKGRFSGCFRYRSRTLRCGGRHGTGIFHTAPGGV